MVNKVNPWELDIRVRDRNLKKGVIADKDVEKLLTGLVDLEGECDPVSIEQPALSPSDDDE